MIPVKKGHFLSCIGFCFILLIEKVLFELQSLKSQPFPSTSELLILEQENENKMNNDYFSSEDDRNHSYKEHKIIKHLKYHFHSNSNNDTVGCSIINSTGNENCCLKEEDKEKNQKTKNLFFKYFTQSGKLMRSAKFICKNHIHIIR